MPTIKRGNTVPWVRKAKAFEHIRDAGGFYNSPTWRKFRKAYIASHPLCIACHVKGEITPATVADHITPIAEGGERFDYNNMQPLCATCHNTKSSHDRWRAYHKRKRI